jgi:ABC-type nitrate/sulfonate/bicarbonate transport system permease component
MRKFPQFGIYLATASLAFLLWELAALIVRGAGFPHFWSVAGEIYRLTTTKAFWVDFTATIWISSLGLVIGSLIALILGFAMGLNRNVEISSRGTLNFIRVVPSVVLLPLLIASIGASPRTAVILSAFVVAFTFIPYVIRGVADTDKQLVESASLIRLPRFAQFFYLYLPSTVSFLGTGIRLSASRAFGTVVVAGIVAGTPGLGARLYLAQANSDINRVFAYVFIMGITGVLIYALFSQIESRLVKWKVLV